MYVALLIFITVGDISYEFYGASGCEGDPFVFPYPNTCEIVPPTDDEQGTDNGDRDILNPPPSASTTPFPTSLAQKMANGSSLSYCAIANAPSMRPTTVPTARPTTAYPTATTASVVAFTAKQVQ